MPRYRKQELVKAIGSRVAEARKARGWTQAALAEAIGIESVSLSRLETGQRALSLSSLEKVAGALGLGLGDLLDESRELPLTDLGPEEAELLRLFGKVSHSKRQALLHLAKELASGR